MANERKPLSAAQRDQVRKLMARTEMSTLLDIVAIECERRTHLQSATTVAMGLAHIELLARGLTAHING